MRFAILSGTVLPSSFPFFFFFLSVDPCRVYFCPPATNCWPSTYFNHPTIYRSPPLARSRCLWTLRSSNDDVHWSRWVALSKVKEEEEKKKEGASSRAKERAYWCVSCYTRVYACVCVSAKRSFKARPGESTASKAVRKRQSETVELESFIEADVCRHLSRASAPITVDNCKRLVHYYWALSFWPRICATDIRISSFDWKLARFLRDTCNDVYDGRCLGFFLLRRLFVQ